MQHQIELIPVSQAKEYAEEPLNWSLKLWGQGKLEFSADDWRNFYKKAMNSDYSKFNSDGADQELLFMAIRTADGTDEVVASIALCDFDDIEEYRQFKPWIAAFIVREDLRGSGVGSVVLELMEKKILTYGVKHIYLWTEGEKNFYGKRGYQLIDQLNKPGRVIDLMQKDLGQQII